MECRDDVPDMSRQVLLVTAVHIGRADRLAEVNVNLAGPDPDAPVAFIKPVRAVDAEGHNRRAG